METKKKENVEFLTKQVFYAGFGDITQQELVEAILSGKKEYQLGMMKMFDKDQVTAGLNFRKADNGMDFFNSFDLNIRREGKKDMNQNFRVEAGNTFTFHEAYNLMNGRFVYKKFQKREKKKEENTGTEQKNGNTESQKKEKAKYYAWAYLDPLDKDKNGNQKTVKVNALNPEELKALVNEYPIKGKENEIQLDRLMSSLQRGNRAHSTFIGEGGTEVTRYIEVDARNRSLKVYDENQNLMLLSQKTVKSKDRGQEQKQGQGQPDEGDSPSGKSEKKSKKRSRAQNV